MTPDTLIAGVEGLVLDLDPGNSRALTDALGARLHDADTWALADPDAALDRLLSGWHRLAARPTPMRLDGAHVEGQSPAGQTRTLYVYARPGDCLALLFTPVLWDWADDPEDGMIWRPWADLTPAMRARRAQHAVRWYALTARDLIGLAQRAATCVRDKEPTAAYWQGRSAALLEVVRTHTHPDQHAGLDLFAGLGLFNETPR